MLIWKALSFQHIKIRFIHLIYLLTYRAYLLDK